MKLFAPFLMQWWQLGIFKLGLLAFGAAAGAWCAEFFAGHIPALLAVAAACFAYIGYLRFARP